ncbi:MAG: Crp/Fnr family transcriptional regulator [Clostridia bacterium]|nr:Crp/Fnr family transcriptional regulator [Clostridia bacterium]
MDYSVLEKSTLFRGIPAKVLRETLEGVRHNIQCYDKDETVFLMMDDADRIGIVLEGRVQAQKAFPNGSQINVSVRGPGELIGGAAAFSSDRKYPCDVVAMEPVTVMILRREDLLALMQKDVRILENFTGEIASAAYMLQQRVELLSYGGIAQKAAYWLLMQSKQIGKKKIDIPGSVSRWAIILNVSRTSLHRELKRLESEGVISYSPPAIEILDQDALQDYLSQ